MTGRGPLYTFHDLPSSKFLDGIKAVTSTDVAAAREAALKEAEAICDEKNAAMVADGEYQHGYWDACNEIKTEIILRTTPPAAKDTESKP